MIYQPPSLPPEVPGILYHSPVSILKVPTIKRKSNFTKDGIYLRFSCPANSKSLTLKNVSSDYYFSAFGTEISEESDINLVKQVKKRSEVIILSCKNQVPVTIH
jgi:hypothetical protein